MPGRRQDHRRQNHHPGDDHLNLRGGLRLRLGIAAGLGGAGAVGSYYAAVKATDAWASSVKAMVDVGRIPLAKALGLQIPAKLAEERDMWLRVAWLLEFAYKPQAGTELDPYRHPPNTNPEDGTG